eukprot:6310560-Alexandrium_andersonii.AAC.1
MGGQAEAGKPAKKVTERSQELEKEKPGATPAAERTRPKSQPKDWRLSEGAWRRGSVRSFP